MNLSYQQLTREEANQRFELDKYKLLASVPNDAIIVLEGDITIDTFLSESSITSVIFNGERTTAQELIIVNGNLTVKGGISIGSEGKCPSLLVLGDLHCDSLESTDDFIEVTGDAYIKYIFDGNYNHGAIKIAGTTHVPYILNSDHCSNLNPSDNAIVINYYNSSDDFFKYDYYAGNLVDVCIPKVFNLEQEELDEMDEDDREDVEFDRITFAIIVESGRSPLKENATSNK